MQYKNKKNRETRICNKYQTINGIRYALVSTGDYFKILKLLSQVTKNYSVSCPDIFKTFMMDFSRELEKQDARLSQDEIDQLGNKILLEKIDTISKEILDEYIVDLAASKN